MSRGVGGAGDVDELLRLVANRQPDLAITDIRMPPTQTTEGLRAARHIRRHYPGVGVLVLSQHVETETLFELLGDDPDGFGYLLKAASRRPVRSTDGCWRSWPHRAADGGRSGSVLRGDQGAAQLGGRRHHGGPGLLDQFRPVGDQVDAGGDGVVRVGNRHGQSIGTRFDLGE